jgi:DNA repair and recombination protein RAD54B
LIDQPHLNCNNNAKMLKPFRPPLIKKVEQPVSVDLTASDSDAELQGRPYKKRKLHVHVVEDSPPKKAPIISKASLAPRKPLLVVKNPSETTDPLLPPDEGPEGYYMVLW